MSGDYYCKQKIEEEPAVSVRNAFKRYGENSVILNNFNMTVEPGTIYGLLGSSGCGKTTILSSIVGLKKLDSGSINVFGNHPRTKESGIPGHTVGYMPQDIGLYKVFTIQEILQYFGKIYGMTKNEVETRINFLVRFLDLPDSTRQISDLSGGQSRRVSIAVAMINLENNPQKKLLILDEPTVGLDELLRESIWAHLCQLVKEKQTTIIITTHYIQESRNCNRIGIMRNGRLLTEQSPTKLLYEYHTDLLEDIVLQLCKNDNFSLPLNEAKSTNEITEVLSEVSFYSSNIKINSKASENVQGMSYKPRSPENLTIRKLPKSYENSRSAVENLMDNTYSNYNKISALVNRNILTLLRYPTFLMSVICIPTLHIILFYFVLGDNISDLSVSVVNHEFSNSTDYLDTICKQMSISCFNDGLSCNFLNAFPQDVLKWVPYLSEKDALKSVQQGQSIGYISIPSNFTQNFKERLLYRHFATNQTMDGSEIGIRIDMSDYLHATFLRQAIYKHFVQFTKKILSDCGQDGRSAEIPIKFHPAVADFIGTNLDFILPGQILLIIFITPMAAALTLVWDKKSGTSDRNWVAGVNIFHVFASFIISEGLVIVISLALFFGVLILVFNHQIKGSIPLAFLLCHLQGITGLSFGFLFGTICNQELEAVIAVLSLYLPTILVSGSVWPWEAVPDWMKYICEILPSPHSIEALRSIFNRGWGLSNSHVSDGFVYLICWTVFCCFASGIIHKNKN